jgi:hypothetical protein
VFIRFLCCLANLSRMVYEPHRNIFFKAHHTWY